MAPTGNLRGKRLTVRQYCRGPNPQKIHVTIEILEDGASLLFLRTE